MSTILDRLGLADSAWLDPFAAALIVLASLLAALLFNRVLLPLALRVADFVPTELDSHLVRAARWPVTLGLLVLGVYLALTIPLHLEEAHHRWVDVVARALGTILGIMLVAGLVSRTLDWYLERLGELPSGIIDDRFFPLLRRVAVVIIYVLGGLLILDILQINISPLIAGLGIGGLAVALAVRPTLSDLFAGTYVLTEGAIKTGDYIELQSGVEGYVVGVGWRSTRIRTWTNNLVVIPNAHFAETVITNYGQPVPAVNVYLTCGVSYDSNLEHVEAVSREVMEHLLETDPNAIKSYGAWFGYDSFSDSNISFWLFIQARDRLASFDLQSALIRDLHRRFREEGIVINYPVRTLRFPEGWTPPNIRPPEGE